MKKRTPSSPEFALEFRDFFYCMIGQSQPMQRSNDSKGMERTASHDLPGDINIKQLFKPGMREINSEG